MSEPVTHYLFRAQCLTRPVPNCRGRSGFWLVPIRRRPATVWNWSGKTLGAIHSTKTSGNFGPTGEVSKKRVHLLRWTNFPGRTGCNFGWMDHAHCPQGLFSPFFSFLRAIFSCPFSLSLAPTICPWVSEDEFYCSQPLPRATSPSAFPFHIPRFRLEGIIPLFSLYPKGYQSIEVWLKLLSQGTGQNLRSQLKDFTDPFIHKESFKISPLFIHNFDPATHQNFRQLKVVSCEQNT